MAVREGLLALLSDKPRHGYELRAEFEARTDELWRLNSGQVYTTLDRLERDGLVDADDDPDDPSGRRRLYRITDAGQAELRAWLDASSWTAEPHRDELLMKVLLAAHDPAAATRVIADHRHALLSRLQHLRREQRDTPEMTASLAHHLVTDALVARLEADLQWLDRCEQRLARHLETLR
ncbi:MAG: PadR family transcriptional regulator [Aquihabitans sp.]